MFFKSSILISFVFVAAAQWTAFPTADTWSESPGASLGPSGQPPSYSGPPSRLPMASSDSTDQPAQYSDGPTWLPSVPSDTSGGPSQYSDGPTWVPSVPSDTSGGPSYYSDGPTWVPSVPSDTSGGPSQYSDGPTWLPSVPSDTSGAPSQYSDGPTWVPSVPSDTSGVPPSRSPVGPSHSPDGPSECDLCEHIIAQARYYFNNNVTNEQDLQRQLIKECENLPPQEGPSAENTCKNMVNNNIDKIFSQHTGPTPPAPSECDICEHLIAQARHHFNNGATTEAALQKELIQECEHLPPQEGASGEQTCKDMVNNNIDKIYSDIKAGDRDGQTCFDIGACTSIPTFQTRPAHTRPPTVVRAQRK
ncbi:unnamed protein product [Heligmosomoides polygyrus]|uniref:Saposin B-type domain-containing protein n=1 Tax=Heligmosomoides polygyrus TaxID=6339 RepID=A0A3P8B0P8_HELPZ|nr:unnamed protein product [Heligmosomoides polygyrus]